MGIGATPEQVAKVAAMVVGEYGPDWLILKLPDGRYAALWAQGLDGEHGAGVARGDYSGCFAICYSAKAVREAIDEGGNEASHFDPSVATEVAAQWFAESTRMIESGDLAEISGSAAKIFSVLWANSLLSRGRSFQAVDAIAATAGVSVSSTRVALHELERMGYAEKSKVGNSTLYRSTYVPKAGAANSD